MSVVFHEAAKISDVAVGSMTHLHVADREIALINLGGTFYAIGGICTHGAARLANGYIEGELVECPQHGGTFDIKTGHAVDYPCTVNVKKYDLRIDGDTISIGWEPLP
ncbi:MAG TPA: non-heme iron oxygenase ferredoxin subunit [Candidatus Lustribacter sp.]|jgi:nitrite reductase/ring-hydroxylating ferredoxin subunit|nr:non-heme iron oxygenase ferredoxin subunit [Candidatus Lustribacter sp.]